MVNVSMTMKKDTNRMNIINWESKEQLGLIDCTHITPASSIAENNITTTTALFTIKAQCSETPIVTK